MAPERATSAREFIGTAMRGPSVALWSPRRVHGATAPAFTRHAPATTAAPTTSAAPLQRGEQRGAVDRAGLVAPESVTSSVGPRECIGAAMRGPSVALWSPRRVHGATAPAFTRHAPTTTAAPTTSAARLQPNTPSTSRCP
ncbi:hypothetical protein SRB17_36090 [Streptomyces sp. RB17]|uniref:hypothetical protein n=1 Tax=Streptomyces sp. RB17 TaxID=2585197 RepID=UPI0012955AC5|nr:hypothetical protein [Streptomyces sp. RB17]MQY35628.1 hypothetical protein [Streptomyces sp. RB17]